MGVDGRDVCHECTEFGRGEGHWLLVSNAHWPSLVGYRYSSFELQMQFLGLGYPTLDPFTLWLLFQNHIIP